MTYAIIYISFPCLYIFASSGHNVLFERKPSSGGDSQLYLDTYAYSVLFVKNSYESNFE